MNSTTDKAGDVIPDRRDRTSFICRLHYEFHDRRGRSFSPKTDEALGILCGYSCRQIYTWRISCKIQDDDHSCSLIGGFLRSSTVDVINQRLHEAPENKNLSINDRLFSQMY
jgi:hypothetical protein